MQLGNPLLGRSAPPADAPPTGRETVTFMYASSAWEPLGKMNGILRDLAGALKMHGARHFKITIDLVELLEDDES